MNDGRLECDATRSNELARAAAIRAIRSALFLVLVIASCAPAAAQATGDAPSPDGVAQLRLVIGTWDVTTEFIAADESVSQQVRGQYHFEWVVPDRIVSGVSNMPEPNQVSALLFFLRPSRSEIEMLSVGRDGHVWRMIGPDDGETRTTPDTPMADGSTMMLRFTRYDVSPDSFRSRMEISTDGGGGSWRLGNRQHFTRARIDG